MDIMIKNSQNWKIYTSQVCDRSLDWQNVSYSDTFRDSIRWTLSKWAIFYEYTYLRLDYSNGSFWVSGDTTSYRKLQNHEYCYEITIGSYFGSCLAQDCNTVVFTVWIFILLYEVAEMAEQCTWCIVAHSCLCIFDY